jgi:co-chaperonin GroES (HSP10)
MKYRVLGESILVKRDPSAEEGDVLMPHNVKKKPKSGVVLSVGKKVEEVVVGERVWFNEYAGYFLEENEDLEESDLIVMREDEVLAVEQGETSPCSENACCPE